MKIAMLALFVLISVNYADDEVKDAIYLDPSRGFFCNDDSDHDIYDDVYGYIDFDDLEEEDLIK